MVTVVAPFIRAPASQSPAIRKKRKEKGGSSPRTFGLFLSLGSASSSPVARPRSSMVSCRSRSIHEGDTEWGGGPGLGCGHVKVVTTGRLRPSPDLDAHLADNRSLKHTIRRHLPRPRSLQALSSLNLSNDPKLRIPFLVWITARSKTATYAERTPRTVSAHIVRERAL